MQLSAQAEAACRARRAAVGAAGSWRHAAALAGNVAQSCSCTLQSRPVAWLAKHMQLGGCACADRGGCPPNVWQVDKLMTHDVCGPGTFGIFQKEFGENAQVRAGGCGVCRVSGWCGVAVVAPATAAAAAAAKRGADPGAAQAGVPSLLLQHLQQLCTDSNAGVWAVGVGQRARGAHPRPLHLHQRPTRQPQRGHPAVRGWLSGRLCTAHSAQCAGVSTLSRHITPLAPEVAQACTPLEGAA